MKKIIYLLVLSFGLFPIKKIQAQTDFQPQVREAEVLEVLESGERAVAGQSAPYQLLRVKFLDGKDQVYQLEHGGLPTVNFTEFDETDKVFVNLFIPVSELDQTELITNSQASISGFASYRSLGWVAFLFVAAVIIATGWQGIKSIISLILSFGVIFQVVLPLLLRNVDPVLVSVSAAGLLIPITFYLSHGFKRKTHVAVVATVICLAVASLLASTLVNVLHLTGFASEEAGFILLEQEGELNVRGLLLAGIIIGLLGTLDDVSVTQAGVVFSLKKNNEEISLKDSYNQAMKVGQDHITSMVNTLVLVYAGASLPLLLLFVNNPHPMSYVLSQEVVLEEIVRTVVSSIGLILAAPLTTALASLLANWQSVKNKLQVK